MRVWFALEHRLGVLRRRAPAGSWDDFAACPSRCAYLGLYGLTSYLAGPTADTTLAEAEEIHAGRIRLFSGQAREVGSPPAWHRSPITGATWPANVHWSLIGDAGQSDIKGVWEASRWSWVYPLARAHARDRDPRHAERFWSWADDWMAANPPNLGVNWKCGQEASFRLFAAAWALTAFADAPSTTPGRVQRLARLAQVTGNRIEAHLAYAVSQDNNHGISEAVGLLTAGVIWPELPDADRWRAKGLRTLSQLCDRLVATDGSFSQHSSNYHRVLLDDLCWAAAVARAGDIELPDNVRAAARRAADFLHALLLPDGSVIRYGADDGARVLQLSACGYDDFRPTLAACAELFGSRRLAAGPWDEQAAALGPIWRARDGVTLPPADLDAGGLHVRRRGQMALALRVPEVFRTRPSHADQLHLSVFEGSVPLVDDPGTVSYNDRSKPWADLAAARFHNVPVVDGGDPMSKAGRFLWLPWTTCRLEVAAADRLVASHRGFPGFIVRREVAIEPQAIRVTDTFIGEREAELSVRWHGRDRRNLESLEMHCDAAGASTRWHAAEEATGLGFRADRYAQAVPAHCRMLSVRATRATFITRIPVAVS